MKPAMNIIVEDIEHNNDYELNNVVLKVEFNNMDEDGNDRIDNSEENKNEVEGQIAVQGNI